MKQMSPEHYHRQVETPCHAISNVHMEHFLEINGQDQGNLLTTKSLEHRNFNNIFCDFFLPWATFFGSKNEETVF